MSGGRARLAAAAIVCVAWLGWLMALALTAGKPTIVARPQLLVADLVVVAELEDGARKAPPPRQGKLPVLPPLPQGDLVTSLLWFSLAQSARHDAVPMQVVSTPVEPVGNGPFEEVIVKEVLWPGDREQLKGKTLVVRNLRLCERSFGWEGPGRYVLALTERRGPGGTVYLVTPMPRSPGYDPPRVNEKVGLAPALIYQDTPEVRRQVEHILKSFHGH